jgi:hypothetical protein
MKYLLAGGLIGFLAGGVIGGAAFGPIGSLAGSLFGIPLGAVILYTMYAARENNDGQAHHSS